jgi:putative glycosyltransferase
VKVSVVTPLYRSAPYVGEFHRRSVEAVKAMGADSYEIIFVNDAGPDDSLERARQVADRDPNVVVVELARNFGQHAATLAGLARVTGDLVYIVDSDLEEEPEWMIPFFEAMNAGDYDVVFGVSQRVKGGYFYGLSRWFFYLTLNLFSAAKFPENICTARLMKRRYVEALLQFGERELFMAGVWHMTGFRQHAMPVVKQDSSPTTYSLGHLISLFVNALTAFSTRPLIMISVAGIGLSALAFFYVAVIVARKLIYNVSVAGWSSVMAAVLLIGGISLFFNGVMAIYIAKIFTEVKQRPRSIVREIYTSRPGVPEAGDRP